MMEVGVVHIGHAIELKLKEKNISKAEFAKMLGMQPQNVNRLLEKSSIDTNKLIIISSALGYNFFSDYVPHEKEQVNRSDSSNSTSSELVGGVSLDKSKEQFDMYRQQTLQQERENIPTSFLKRYEQLVIENQHLKEQVSIQSRLLAQTRKENT